MTNFARRAVALALLAIAANVTACSDECKQGSTECVTKSLIRTCVPGNDGNEWLVSQCGANEACNPNAPVSSDDDDAGPGKPAAAKSDAGIKAPTQAACVGTCQVGAHECVNDAFARYCVNGGVWQLDPCNVGEKCAEGACQIGQGQGSVQACTPNQFACASDKIVKVCDPDGTAWVESPCASGEVCQNDHCQADPKGSCANGDSCLDNKTAIRCMGNADGYQVETCSGDLYCEAGQCRGSVCAVGATCIGSNQVRTCVDGTSYRDAQCDVNQVCEQDKADAHCVPLQCNPGTSACGDPRDAKVDTKKKFTTCVMTTDTNIPAWVSGDCTGNTTCNPSLASTSNPCSEDCTKGAQRCSNDPLLGVNDGTQECDDTGKWGEVKTCNAAADGRQQCIVQPNPDASQLPKAICVAPICAFAIQNPTVGSTGTCDGDKLRKCQTDGTLADAISCDVGLCRTLRSATAADGFMPGACDTTPECQSGEEVCENSSSAATPRYRSCVNGYFGTQLQTCDGDALCYTAKDDQGLRHKLCGASCSPGSRRCNGGGQLEQCDQGGQWGGATACGTGSCRTIGNNDASCVLDCVPGSKLCTGSAVVAPDGYHAGTTQEISCSDSGSKQAAKDCGNGTVCRVTDSGVALGCVQCIGSAAPGGNDEGTGDSRCDPTESAKLQECGDDNNWATSRDCANGKTCVSPTSGTCGMCVAPSSAMVVCSQTNLSTDTANSTCAGLGYGAPSAWGSVSDCCANYQLGAGSAASFAYCK
jgi:hypothetical protein